MITESELKALQLAKKVFEHFTHDALPIAREIIAMELNLGKSPTTGDPTLGEAKPVNEVKKTDGKQGMTSENNFPCSNLTPIGIEAGYDPAQPVRQMNKELTYVQPDDFPL